MHRTFDLKAGLLNMRSLTSKVLILNEITTDLGIIKLCSTENWITLVKYSALNVSNPCR